MGTIRVEAVPVRSYGLGLFRFDHLQLVFQDETDFIDSQDYWLVIEGIQDGPLLTATLGVSGESGSLSLGVANGASREDLVAKIGTPEARGSRIIKSGPDAFSTWTAMAAYGGEIEDQKFPYIPYSWPFSASPTINSTSLVGSVLWSVGVDLNNLMPFNIRLSPGPETLLGTSGEDALGAGDNFTTVAGGGGSDTLSGSTTTLWLEKLYGGSGADTFMWSYGPNLYHGGQPRMPYASDGTDVVDYKGIGTIYFSANEYAVENKTPDVFATFDGGNDLLFSIERIVWDSDTDIVEAGPGIQLLERPIEFDLKGQSGAKGDTLGMSDGTTPLIVNAVSDDMISVQSASNEGLDAGYWVSSAEWLIGSTADDKIYAGATLTGIEGGDGDDILDARAVAAFSGASPLGYDIEIEGGEGDDTIVSGEGRTFARGGAGADQFVLSTMTSGDDTVEFIIDDADASDSLYIPYDLFKIARGSFEGSTLFQLTGAVFKIDEITSPSFFMWGEPDEDEPQGNIEFVGMISYKMDGGDLLIRIMQGYPETYTVDYGPGEPPGPTFTISVAEESTETIVRVSNWSEGILGIEFPLTWDNNVFANAGSLNDYPGLKDAINSKTAADKFIAPLPERPAAHTPEELNQGVAAASFAARAFSFAAIASEPLTDGTEDDDTLSAPSGGPFTFTARGGNDTITGSDGGDLIDGGTGADAMSGGRGNDAYLVDDAGDTISEGERGGFDTVYAAIDYQLGENLEHVTLEGDALSATGNALRNTLQGNARDNVLTGNAGDDVLAGNAGNDTLRGGVGSDGYVWELGDGSDTIIEDADDPTATDAIVLVGELTPEDVVFIRLPASSDDLILAFPDGGGITLRNYFVPGAQTIEKVLFPSGLSWSAAEIASRAAAAVATRNLAPSARDDAFYYAGGTRTVLPAGALLENDSDADRDTLSVVSLDAVTGGSATLNADGSITLDKAGADSGVVAFDYVVSDGQGGATRAHVDVVFVPNAPPEIITSVVAPVLPGAPAAGRVEARDADGDELFFALADGRGPAHGSVSIGNDGSFIYTPDDGATGRDSFAIAVTDGLGAPAITQFDFEIVAPNGPPVARDDGGFTVAGGETLRVAAAALLANDTDPNGDVLHFVTADSAHGGSFRITSTDIEFTPERGFVGLASFRYTIADASGAESSARVTIDVTNTAPVARDDSGFSVASGATLRIAAAALLANDNDPNGDALRFITGDGVQGGSIQITLTDITFTPDRGFVGEASFRYATADDHGAESSARVTIDVTNTPPVARDDSGLSVESGATLRIAAATLLANDNDPNGNPLTIATVLSGNGGSAVLADDGTILFTAAQPYAGAATFSYTVSDGFDGSSMAFVTVQVAAPIPLPPNDGEASPSLSHMLTPDPASNGPSPLDRSVALHDTALQDYLAAAAQSASTTGADHGQAQSDAATLTVLLSHGIHEV